MQEVIIWDRPQMVGEYYQPKYPSLSELLEESPDITELFTEIFGGDYSKHVVYDPDWETLRWIS